MKHGLWESMQRKRAPAPGSTSDWKASDMDCHASDGLKPYPPNFWARGRGCWNEIHPDRVVEGIFTFVPFREKGVNEEETLVCPRGNGVCARIVRWSGNATLMEPGVIFHWLQYHCLWKEAVLFVKAICM